MFKFLKSLEDMLVTVDVDKGYLAVLFLFALIFFGAGIRALKRILTEIRNKKYDVWQMADENARKSIEETINFLNDEVGVQISPEKRVWLRQMINQKLKREERKNQELIKKMILEEVLKQEEIKKEKIKKEALVLIIKDVLGQFHREFFRKIKKVIVEKVKSTPKKRSSRLEQNRQEQRRKEQLERERREQQNKENEQRRLEQEKEKATQEERQKREKDEEERQNREKEDDDRKKREREEQSRKEAEKQAAARAAAAKAVGGR